MTPEAMPARFRAILVLNGFLLVALAALAGWAFLFQLLGDVVLWPLVPPTGVEVPGTDAQWRAAHLQALTEGLLMLGLAASGPFLLLTVFWHRVLMWSALITAWMFALPFLVHAAYGTRGLAFGGGPFKPGLVNDALYLFGWPPVVAVHIMLVLAVIGAVRAVRSLPKP
jgi:hypothetical protein